MAVITGVGVGVGVGVGDGVGVGVGVGWAGKISVIVAVCVYVWFVPFDCRITAVELLIALAMELPLALYVGTVHVKPVNVRRTLVLVAPMAVGIADRTA